MTRHGLGRFNRPDAFISILGGGFLGLAWLFPGEGLGALFGWLSAFCFVTVALSTEENLLFLYIAGALSHCIAFYWLSHTIAAFGGFGIVATTLIFSLFVSVSALQFVLFGIVSKFINKEAKGLCLTTPLAWCSIEYLVFRLFPWQFGHTQLGFLPFAQISDIGGSICVSFMLFWSVELLVRFFINKERSYYFAIPLLFFAASISYGRLRIETFSDIEGVSQKVAVVQANVSIDDKHNTALLQTNVDRYRELSEKIVGPDTLIIWPESVLNDFISTNVGSVGNDDRLPFFESNNPLLIGALTYGGKDLLYNSALAILNSGTVLDPYHKQILMPFGEFMPLSGMFPFLLSLNPNIANFTEGMGVKVFEYPMVRSDDTFYDLRVSPLICYEDIVPRLSRESVRSGAELLVNLTNDAWFGDSIAPYQHNLIASFRAIENRRFLVRSTNTGVSAIITPTGKIASKLPTFSEGTLLAEVKLIGYRTLYTDVIGDRFAWLCVLVTLTFSVFHFVLRKV